MCICALNTYLKNSTVFAYRNNIYIYEYIMCITYMHAYNEYIYIYIHAYMYIHVGVCVHVPIEHDFNRNLGLFHKIHAHRIITACVPICNGDALYM